LARCCSVGVAVVHFVPGVFFLFVRMRVFASHGLRSFGCSYLES
jgi:hypothetical protein